MNRRVLYFSGGKMFLTLRQGGHVKYNILHSAHNQVEVEKGGGT